MTNPSLLELGAMPLAMGLVGELIEWSIIAVVFLVVVNWISKAVPNKRDREWLPQMIIWGFSAKLLGTLVRYYMAADLYGSGDAFGYHGRGIAFASIWRNMSVPVSTAGGEGTAFTEVVTGLIYSIYTPTMRGGFLMFAFIAFMGQILFYVAFRPWLTGKSLKRYAFGLMFVPSIMFWPASVGKDALMILFIGLAALGISRLLQRIELFGLLLAGLGLYLAAQIRPHIAMMVALAAVLAFAAMKRAGSSRSVKRLIPLAAALVGVAFAWSTFAADFEVSLQGTEDTQDPGALLDQVSDRTSQGGSQVTDGTVNGITDLPAAAIKVLFRPLIHEATSPVVLMSALEGTVLLIIVVWRLPSIFRNRKLLRPNPLLLLSLFYTGGFIYAFSSVLNLGILARQRVQLLPFFLALIAALGWPQEEDAEEQPDRERSPRDLGSAPRRDRLALPAGRSGESSARYFAEPPRSPRPESR